VKTYAGKVVHFEIPFDKKDRALKFYSDIFGWETIDIPDMDYVMVHAAETDKDNMVAEKGAINGGMFQREKDARAPIIVIGVSSIDETIEKVKALGGKVVIARPRCASTPDSRRRFCGLHRRRIGSRC
jgi:predicted enzyme related to lactoylglutathione lyase